jgi:hypothetical protein
MTVNALSHHSAVRAALATVQGHTRQLRMQTCIEPYDQSNWRSSRFCGWRTRLGTVGKTRGGAPPDRPAARTQKLEGGSMMRGKGLAVTAVE